MRPSGPTPLPASSCRAAIRSRCSTTPATSAASCWASGWASSTARRSASPTWATATHRWCWARWVPSRWASRRSPSRTGAAACRRPWSIWGGRSRLERLLQVARLALVGPVGDAALERHGVEAGLAHQERGGPRAPPRAAIDDVLALGIEAARALADLVERHQPGPLQPPQLPFLLVAAIDERRAAEIDVAAGLVRRETMTPISLDTTIDVFL